MARFANGVSSAALLSFILLLYLLVSRDIPYLISGVDQILLPTSLLLFKTFLYFSFGLYILSTFLFFLTKILSIFLNIFTLAISILNVALSIYVYGIDSHDMYPHIDEWRILVNLVTFLLFAYMVKKSISRGVK